MIYKPNVFCKRYKITFLLFVITPIIDTINGLYILAHGATGLSIGTFYRIFLLFFVVCKSINYKIILKQYILLFSFILVGSLRGIVLGIFFNSLTYSVKWILPLILIYYFTIACKNKHEIQKCLTMCLDIWSWYVPFSLVVEYTFHIGYIAYHDAGFKGLYYSTNDIALVLIVLYIYILHKLFTKISIALLLQLTFTFIAIIILATKSSIIFAVFSFFYYLLKKKEFHKKNVFILIILFLIGSIFIYGKMYHEINNLLGRYINMWKITSKDSIFKHFMSFATSGRTDRIHSYFQLINNDNSIFYNLLFGWIEPDNAHVIEMDFHDLLCQYGLIGFIIIIFEYLLLFKKYVKKSEPYWLITIVCFIYALLAGHVISGVLSGTIFSIVFSLLLLSHYDITITDK